MGSFLEVLSVCWTFCGVQTQGPFLEFCGPQRVMRLFVSKACLCKDLGLHPPALRPPTHTLAALPSREAQGLANAQLWSGLAPSGQTRPPGPTPPPSLGDSRAECGAQDPTALPAPVCPRQGSWMGLPWLPAPRKGSIPPLAALGRGGGQGWGKGTCPLVLPSTTYPLPSAKTVAGPPKAIS